jgi:peroxiredoxin
MNSGTSLFLQMLFVVLAAVGMYSFVSAAKEGESRRLCSSVCSLAPDYAGRNRTAPDFELRTLEGATVRLSDYRGKVVIMNFWSKTCKPCIEEMPSLNDLGSILRERDDIVLLTVTTDESAADAQATLQSVLRSTGNFVTLVDPGGEVVAGKFGSKLYPETWFIDARGVIRARIDGPRDWLELAPLAIDFATSLKSPLACEVEFEHRKPRGSECSGIPQAG